MLGLVIERETVPLPVPCYLGKAILPINVAIFLESPGPVFTGLPPTLREVPYCLALLFVMLGPIVMRETALLLELEPLPPSFEEMLFCPVIFTGMLGPIVKRGRCGCRSRASWPWPSCRSTWRSSWSR
ncbi:unnamed protein product [Prorocentrum cordatum]|uniref:Uncharacterized protein n=1 Tax=Prorocentrum cordatum TaxID=2364126 RepID=A0ABN9YAX2_9DINO|nr:unnamed protein product [Polarella glacialis]